MPTEPEAPRELTMEEVRTAVLTTVWTCIQYWLNEDRRPTAEEKLQGLAFSILAEFDGDGMNIPKLIVAPDPHPSDKEYHRSNGENWFPENNELDVKCDLGPLHEFFHDVGRKLGYLKEE